MQISIPQPAARLALALLGTIVIGGCHGPSPFEVYGPTTSTFSIAVGQKIDIHMQTAGPGSYATPPTLNGTTIEFLGVDPGPIDPGGITQVFHYRGVAVGTTIITFQRVCGCTLPLQPYSVTDTVFVR